jgi:AcrR family transcriptional regulator
MAGNSGSEGRSGRRDSRREDLLLAAANLFAQKGYEATTIREIAKAVDMLPGSIYYHYPSKEDVLIAVHELGIENFLAAMEKAVAGVKDPWERLERAAVAHLVALTSGDAYAAVVDPYYSRISPAVRAHLSAQRDAYERRFAELVEALELAPDVDRKLFRLHLLGALNWCSTWFKSGQKSAEEIARELIRLLRDGARPR